jgi:hypothetical protein
MGPIRMLAAPIRRIANSRLFQLAFVVAIILLLDHYAYDHAALRPLADGLKKLVTATVELCSEYFRVGILTDPVLQVGLMIAYVYIICLMILQVLRALFGLLVDLVGWSNFLWLRNTIARERGIAAYRAWLPLERIRPADYPQDKWEEAFAWPAGNQPPYPPLPQRMVRITVAYVVVFGSAAALIQLLTPFPILTWIKQFL